MAANSDIRYRQTLDNSQFKNGLKESQSLGQKFGKQMMAIGPMMAGAFSVGAIVSYTKEAMTLAGQLEGVREAFFRIGDQKSLDQLKEATRGTVSELELMKNAVKANNFKIPLTELSTLFEFATKRAAQTGESVQYLVDSIILGIGRKSPLILDNLGISAIELRKKLKGVGMESASVADVTAAMGEIIEEEMVKMGDVTETAAQRMERLKATSEDMKTAWGELANTFSTMVAPALTSLAKGMKEALEGTQALNDSESLSWWDKLRISLSMVVGDASSVGNILGNNLDPALEDTAAAGKNFNDTLEESAEVLEVDKDAAEKAAKAFRDLQKAKRDADKESMKTISGGIKPVTTDELMGSGALTDKQEQLLGAFQQVGTSRITGMQLPTKELSEFDIALRNTYQGMSAFTEGYQNWADDVINVNELMGESFKGLAMNMASAMASAVETWVNGGDGLQSLFNGMLGAVADFLRGLGSAMMASGLAGIALKSLSTNPALAIAAGLALQLAAGAIQGIMDKGPGMAQGGIVPGGFPGDTYPARLTSGEMVIPPHKLDSVMGGRQVIVLDTEIRGESLYILQKKITSKHNRYT